MNKINYNPEDTIRLVAVMIVLAVLGIGKMAFSFKEPEQGVQYMVPTLNTNYINVKYNIGNQNIQREVVNSADKSKVSDEMLDYAIEYMDLYALPAVLEYFNVTKDDVLVKDIWVDVVLDNDYRTFLYTFVNRSGVEIDVLIVIEPTERRLVIRKLFSNERSI